MERTLRINGKAFKKVKADYVSLGIGLNEKNKNQSKAIATLNERVGSLNEKVVSLGFEKEDLKLESFEVNPEYNWDNGKQTFVGYNANYRFTLEFDFDSDRLLKMIDEFSTKSINATIDTSFRVKDEEAVKVEILEELTADAKRKALALAKASGVVLGDLVSVDYNYVVEHFVSPTSYRMSKNMIMEEACYDGAVAFTPSDVTIEDSADFVWEIK